MIRAAEDDGDVDIVVEDAGSGISRADVGARSSRSSRPRRARAATGLGLAIAHEIVANHRGTLTLAPSPRGTRAAIRLPPARRAP